MTGAEGKSNFFSPYVILIRCQLVFAFGAANAAEGLPDDLRTCPEDARFSTRHKQAAYGSISMG